MYRKFILSFLVLAFGLDGGAQEKVSTDSLENLLNEVVVTASHTTRMEGNRLVTIVAGSNLANLGNAYDVLGQIPLVKVDENNTVTVTGKGTPKIYIDGRPLKDDTELRTLLSTNLKKVELQLAPGAKYDSTTQAVILITTRRNFIKGLSIINMGELRIGRETSANDVLNLSYHSKNFEIFGSGLFAHNNSRIKGYSINHFEYQGKPMVIGSSQNNEYPGNNTSAKLGFNFSTGAHLWGAYYKLSTEHGDFNNHGAEWIDDETPLQRVITNETISKSHLVNAYYDGTFSDKLHLHFDGEYRHSAPRSNVSTHYTSANIAKVNSSQYRHSTLYAGKLYMDYPLAGGSFTFGTEDSHTSSTLHYLMLNHEVESYIPSSFTEATQTAVALFASWDKTFGKFNLSAGARYEYVNYLFKVNDVKDTDVSRKNHTLTPDITFGFTPSDDTSLSLSYKMATVKPPYSQLTGGLIYAGVHQIEGGNPALRDERMHQLQLFGMWKNFMLQTFFMRSLDTYAFVKKLYPAPTPQLIMQPINIDVSSFHLYLIWEKNIRKWSPNLTLGMSTQWLEIDGVKYNKPFFMYGFNNSLQLPGGFILTANINGQSGGDMHTNRFRGSWFSVNMDLSKRFFNRALTVKLSAKDIFNTINNDWSMTTYGVTMNKYQKYDIRSISLNLTYQFQPKQSKYKGRAASESESNRL